MTHLAYLAATAALAIAAAPVVAGKTMTVGWPQLRDPVAQEFEDPYRDLAAEQMSDLMSLVRLREKLAAESLTAERREELEARTSVLEADLDVAQIDVEWVLAQRWAVADRRRQAAVATNSALDGRSVEMAGYLITSPPTHRGEAIAYLLPDRGLCNHLPPPPPNQLVRLDLKKLPETEGYCVPVSIRGTLRAEEGRHEVMVIDHHVPMWSAWVLQTDQSSTSILTP